MSEAPPETIAREVAVPDEWPEADLIKLDSQAMMELAIKNPRTDNDVLATVVNQFKQYPQIAEEAIYVRPVGKDDSNKSKEARGLSIRAAEAIAEAKGANVIATDVIAIKDDNDRVRVDAVFVDLAKLRITRRRMIVSKNYRGRGGSPLRHSDDRFYNTVVPAAAARQVRWCILSSLSPRLRLEIYRAADFAMRVEGITVEQIGQLVDAFDGVGVPLAMLERFLGKKIDLLTIEERVDLRHRYNAIFQQEATADEVFNIVANEGKEKDQGKPVVSSGDSIAEDIGGQASKQTQPADRSSGPAPAVQPSPTVAAVAPAQAIEPPPKSVDEAPSPADAGPQHPSLLPEWKQEAIKPGTPAPPPAVGTPSNPLAVAVSAPEGTVTGNPSTDDGALKLLRQSMVDDFSRVPFTERRELLMGLGLTQIMQVDDVKDGGTLRNMREKIRSCIK